MDEFANLQYQDMVLLNESANDVLKKPNLKRVYDVNENEAMPPLEPLVPHQEPVNQRMSPNVLDTLSPRIEKEAVSPLEPLVLSQEQKAIFDRVIANENVFFTGPAGCGKSHLLNAIRQHFASQPDVFVTATTGVAATNINGCTLHSFAGIGLAKGTLQDLIQNISHYRQTVKRWKNCRILIVDEISMLSAELFEKVEAIARHFRCSNAFFGGIQTIFVGDFAQLPPVGDDRVVPKMVFQSDVWKSANLYQVALQQIFRQRDDTMIRALGDLRRGEVSQRVLDFVQSVSRTLVFDDGILPTHLYARNANVDQENEQQLATLEGKPFVYHAVTTGGKKDADDMSRKAMAADEIVLKIGAQVMYLVNVQEGYKLCNGSRGIVVGFSPTTDHPIVQFVEHKEPMTVKPYTWHKKIGNTTVATRTQIPLKLAWAITIHKSQGLGLDRVIIDLEGCFAHGQAYVAFSRATNKDGLEVRNFAPALVLANPDVSLYYQTMEQKT